jgi:AcrR family transcriptional regulator
LTRDNASKDTMTTAGSHKSKAEGPRLSRDDWFDAAFQEVVEGGFDQARVLIVANRLKVTRGSFYWHFKDHADLISGLTERWHQREIAAYQTLREASVSDPHADLERLLDAALAHAGNNMENMRFELALRGLGRRDAEVAQMLVEVDQMRMRLFTDKFERLIPDATEASNLAALFYLAIVGSYQALSRPSSPPQVKEFLKSIIGKYIIHRR